MKSLSPTLQASLAGGVTTMAYCGRVTRRDGTVLGFTEHDRDIAYAGTVFEAATGFSATQVDQSLDLSVDTLNAAGALASPALTETDILAGRYDDAQVELFWVDWIGGTGVTVAAGNIGEVTRAGLSFSAEFRSLANRLNQVLGTTCERLCSAQLGDGRCKISLTVSSFRANAVMRSGGPGAELTVDGLSGYAADWFTFGTVTASTGANTGLVLDVKAHLRTSGTDLLLLWEPPPFAMAAGDGLTVTAGCRKTLATCRGKFGNVANFRGFPHIPGADVVTRYAVQGALDASGGSLFAGA